MAKHDSFKIGELSKYFHIGVDSIRYYEKVGILNPVRNEENNYRSYTNEDFHRLALIREMLGLGFNTEQIKDYVADRDLAKTQMMLHTELDSIDGEIKRLRKIQKTIENRLDLIENLTAMYDDEQIKEVSLPDRHCIMIREKHSPDRLVDYYLIKHMNKTDSQIGTIGICDCYTLDLENSNPESDYYRTKNVFFYSKTLNKKDCNYTLPEGTYLSILYRGSLKKTKLLLPKMYDYAKKHKFEIIGDPIEFCFIDDYETNIEEEYLIEIQLPVKK